MNPNGNTTPKPEADAPAAPIDMTDWRAEAKFWQLKYFEQLMHSTQVITALSRPMLGDLMALQQQAQAAAAAAAK